MFLALLLSSLLTFVELNCENLFDTRHDSLKNDMEFTPEGSYHWTRTRYWRKLNNLAKELVALGEKGNKEWEIPDLVALCEVENDTVMTDLTKRSLLRLAGYEYLMTSSPDERGIDVALMYLPSSFCPLRSYPIRIKSLAQVFTDIRHQHRLQGKQGRYLGAEERVELCQHRFPQLPL